MIQATDNTHEGKPVEPKRFPVNDTLVFGGLVIAAAGAFIACKAAGLIVLGAGLMGLGLYAAGAFRSAKSEG